MPMGGNPMYQQQAFPQYPMVYSNQNEFVPEQVQDVQK